MKRYFFIAGVPHESDNGSWLKFEELRCDKCAHWKIDPACRGWENNHYGDCMNPVVEIQIDGDACVDSRLSNADAFCSNFESI